MNRHLLKLNVLGCEMLTIRECPLFGDIWDMWDG
jgi:hypothetical protein